MATSDWRLLLRANWILATLAQQISSSAATAASRNQSGFRTSRAIRSLSGSNQALTRPLGFGYCFARSAAIPDILPGGLRGRRRV